jgi:predicted dehydrogenase
MPVDIKVVLIGAGWAGQQHARSIASLPGATLAAVVDPDSERVQRLAQSMDATPFADPVAAIDLVAPDAVVIATPPGEHRRLAVLALERGMATFIEKPLARHLDDGDAIVSAADASGAVCAVGYQWRALDILSTLRAYLAEHPPALLSSRSIGITQSRPWFQDRDQTAGFLHERASHDIDLQRAVAGDIATVVATVGSLPLHPGVKGDITALHLGLNFASGAVGSIALGWVPPGAPERYDLAVISSDSSYDLILDPWFELTAQFPAPRNVPDWEDPWLVKPQRTLVARQRSQEGPFLRQMRLFLEAVRRSDPAAVASTPRDGRGTLAVVSAAEQAVQHPGAAIPVPP